MTTEQYLGQIDRLNKVIQNKLVEIYQLKTMACNIVVSNENERVQTSGSQERMADTVAKIVDKEKDIGSLIDLQLEKKNSIISQIEGMENTNMYHVLFCRYVKNDNFTEIGNEMGYSRMQIKRLHDDAIDVFEEKYGDLYLNA